VLATNVPSHGLGRKQLLWKSWKNFLSIYSLILMMFNDQACMNWDVNKLLRKLPITFRLNWQEIRKNYQVKFLFGLSKVLMDFQNELLWIKVEFYHMLKMELLNSMTKFWLLKKSVNYNVCESCWYFSQLVQCDDGVISMIILKPIHKPYLFCCTHRDLVSFPAILIDFNELIRQWICFHDLVGF
jgi:hypothetical protein